MRVRYWDPTRDAAVTTHASVKDLADLVEALLAHRTGRGHPALEMERPDGSTLVLCTDGHRAAITWTNSLGESFRSVGPGDDSDVLVFDYLGSWSEAPGSSLVKLEDASLCLERFVSTGAPDNDRVLFEPE